MRIIDADRLSFMQEEADTGNNDWVRGYNFCLQKVKREILTCPDIEIQNEASNIYKHISRKEIT